MKQFVFILGVVVTLAIFGPPILACFMGLLAIGLGVAVEVAFPIAFFLTLALVIGMGVKKFFIDD